MRLILSILFLVSLTESIKDIPSYIKIDRCHRYDPKLHECLLNATELARPYLIEGVPELGFASVDPLMIPEVYLQQGTQALVVRSTLSNIIIHGLSNYKFSKFDFNVSSLEVFIEGKIGQLEMDADYNVTGRILFIPVEGAGRVNLTLDGVNATCYQKIKIIQRKGVDFANSVTTKTTIQVFNLKANVEGLFDGNPTINALANRVINENIDVLFEDMKPVFEKTIEEYLEKTLLNTLENNVPYDKLFPPIP